MAKRRGKGLAAKGPGCKGSFSAAKMLCILIVMTGTKLQLFKLGLYI